MGMKIVNNLKHGLPSYSTDLSVGMNLRANIEEDIVFKPLCRALIKTDLFLELPLNYEALIRLGSGLAINKGITVRNSPGTIDSDYRGEDCIILMNLSEDNSVIRDSERICQMVIAKQDQAELVTIEDLLDISGGTGGFKHTGKK
jgi:dUTP pyrophosphatase